MKKYIAVFLLLLTTIAVSAENMKPIINKYKKQKGVVYVHLNPFLLWMAKPFMKTNGVELSSLSVLTMEKAGVSEKTFLDFNRVIDKTIRNCTMEPFVIVNEEDSKVRIYAEMKDDYIKELLVLVYENDESVIVQLKGKFKPEDIDDNFMENIGIK